MQIYSQKDSRWAKIPLGTCTDTIAQSGCIVTCYGMLADITPDQVNEHLKSGGGFTDGCLINWTKAAQVMGLQYLGSSTGAAKVFPCIGCTDHFSKIVNGKEVGTPNHSFVMLDANTINDALDGKQKKNPYKITKYENVTTNEDDMSQADQDELVSLRLFKQQVVDNKLNEYRIDGQATVYEIYAIPGAEHFAELGNSWENVRILPADWPLHPEDWVAARTALSTALQQALTDSQLSKGQIATLEQQAADLGQQLHNAESQTSLLVQHNEELVQQVKDLTDANDVHTVVEPQLDQDIDMVVVSADNGGFWSKISIFLINLAVHISKFDSKNE